MKKIVDYFLLRETCRYNLNNRVREFIEKGWSVKGSPFSEVDCHEIMLYQAMVKYEEEPRPCKQTAYDEYSAANEEFTNFYYGLEITDASDDLDFVRLYNESIFKAYAMGRAGVKRRKEDEGDFINPKIGRESL